MTKIFYLSAEVEIKLILASSASNQSGSLNGPELNPFFVGCCWCCGRCSGCWLLALRPPPSHALAATMTRAVLISLHKDVGQARNGRRGWAGCNGKCETTTEKVGNLNCNNNPLRLFLLYRSLGTTH